MNGIEALYKMMLGKKVRNVHWNKQSYLYFDKEKNEICSQHGYYGCSSSLFEATSEWELFQEEKIYYKVLRYTLQSAMTSKYSVNYKIGRWVKPTIQNSKLFVFDTLENARKFLDGNRDFVIYSCHVKNPTIGDRKYCSPNSMYIIDFWQGRSNAPFIEAAPIGTIFADEVKLIEKVASV